MAMGLGPKAELFHCLPFISLECSRWKKLHVQLQGRNLQYQWNPLPPPGLARVVVTRAAGCGVPPGVESGERCLSCRSDKGGGVRRRLAWPRSEEHTSELQSRENLVCRLLL